AWSSFLSIICLSSPMFGFNDRQLHRIQDSLSPEDKSLSVQMPHSPFSLRMPESSNSLNSLYPILCLYDLAIEKPDTFGQLPI
ncbi:MAG: hypothetical protein KZQ81_07565, partial [Candidatus Thiodiazotropha sp. (ex Rostrolucina anterorostrata)]|nr:hypothetical protein [Candidatus Thiodiazotropha sp. (ex Rostrolucina anterorostrata)]